MSRQPNEKINYLYGRLSHEDELQGDSNSIINQRKILTRYAEDNGFTPYEFIYDDGFSGADFERPPLPDDGGRGGRKGVHGYRQGYEPLRARLPESGFLYGNPLCGKRRAADRGQ